MVLGIALFKFRSLNKDVLSRLFPQKNRRISFHKSADFLNAFFIPISALPLSVIFYRLSRLFPSFSVLLPPPFPQTGFFLVVDSKTGRRRFFSFSKAPLVKSPSFKKASLPSASPSKVQPPPAKFLFTPRKLPAIPLCKPLTSSRKSRGKVRPLRLPERRILLAPSV